MSISTFAMCLLRYSVSGKTGGLSLISVTVMVNAQNPINLGDPLSAACAITSKDAMDSRSRAEYVLITPVLESIWKYCLIFTSSLESISYVISAFDPWSASVAVTYIKRTNSQICNAQCVHHNPILLNTQQ